MFRISVRSQSLSKNDRPFSKRERRRKKTRNVLISRGQVSITTRLRVVSGYRCHLSSFSRLPLFRGEGKIKTPGVGERRKDLGCGCETDGRGDGTPSIEPKIDLFAT